MHAQTYTKKHTRKCVHKHSKKTYTKSNTHNTHARIQANTNACIHKHSHNAHTNTQIHTQTHNAHTNMQRQIHTQTNAQCTHKHTNAYISKHTHAYKHTNTYTHKHTNTYTNKHTIHTNIQTQIHTQTSNAHTNIQAQCAYEHINACTNKHSYNAHTNRLTHKYIHKQTNKMRIQAFTIKYTHKRTYIHAHHTSALFKCFPNTMAWITCYTTILFKQEMLKKCSQCMEIIVCAKDRQAAEANKNASILLQQLDDERVKDRICDCVSVSTLSLCDIEK